MEKLNELVELAKKATPGRWWIDSHGHTMVAFSGEVGDVEVVFSTDNNMGPPVRHDDTGNLSHWRNDNNATFIAAANPDTILAIAAAFRALEQENTLLKQGCENDPVVHEMLDWKERAEAAEAKLETENKWRDLALQFDGHRMQAISLLKMIVNDAPAEQHSSVRNFLKCGPLSGEEVMNERLLAIANSRPATAVSLAELVFPVDGLPDNAEESQEYRTGFAMGCACYAKRIVDLNPSLVRKIK